MQQWDCVWLNANLAGTECGDGFGIINDGAIAIKNNRIAWLGPLAELPDNAERSSKEIIDAQQQWITPGLIDCHTHLVYAGNRNHEFAQRFASQVSYEELAKAGGGILSTVAATRAASEDELFQQSAKRLQAMMAQGVTCVEIKSGYGLDLDNEIKMLRVAKQLAQKFSVTIKTTLLAAHAIPNEYKNRADDYIDYVCHTILPQAAELQLADAVDVFCEGIGFDLQQTEQVFAAAKQHGLAIKCHAEQLSDLGGAALAARYQALSADHLEYANEASIKAMAASGTVAVLLPGAFYYLQETKLPPIELLRKHQVPIAIATDCNPGSSPTTSLLLMMSMACNLFQLRPEEAFAAVTKHAAAALGLADSHGGLAVGKVADFAFWDIDHPLELLSQFGSNQCVNRYIGDE